MRVSDEQLAYWTKPAFGNEKTKAENTEQIIRTAVMAHPVLSKLRTRVFAKGSYKNNTNVRRDSDIDIAVEYQGYVALDYAEGTNMSHTGYTPYRGISPQDYKKAVGEAMRKAFGAASVDGSGNRVFAVKESSRSLLADVVPCTTYHLQGLGWSRQGIQLILDRPDGLRHYNYPEQHYDNGTSKNTITSKRYKRVVRILKNIEAVLVKERRMPPLPSFVIECVAYNITNAVYDIAKPLRKQIQDVLIAAYWYLQNPEPLNVNLRWTEVNGHKWLFHPTQKWSRNDVMVFANLAYELVST